MCIQVFQIKKLKYLSIFRTSKSFKLGSLIWNILLCRSIMSQQQICVSGRVWQLREQCCVAREATADRTSLFVTNWLFPELATIPDFSFIFWPVCLFTVFDYFSTFSLRHLPYFPCIVVIFMCFMPFNNIQSRELYREDNTHKIERVKLV